MIAHWPTLRDWIAESRATETARRRIERDAADWQQRGKDRGDLYRRHRLADALDVTAAREHELTQTAARFLTAARRRRLAARLAFTMAIVLALTGVAWLAKTPVRDAWLKREAIDPARRSASRAASCRWTRPPAGASRDAAGRHP